MKIILAFVCAVAVAASAGLFFEQQKVSALQKQVDELKQQAAQAAALQDQLASANQAAAGAASSKEEQTQELARLRNEVTEMRKKTNDLAKARQQIQALNERVASEAEAKKGALAEAQEANQRIQAAAQQGEQHKNACINNLRLIDAAKQQWALENRKQATDTPTWDDLRPYVGRGPKLDLPSCPDGGAYTIGTVGEKPACSVAGHVLP